MTVSIVLNRLNTNNFRFSSWFRFKARKVVLYRSLNYKEMSAPARTACPPNVCNERKLRDLVLNVEFYFAWRTLIDWHWHFNFLSFWWCVSLNNKKWNFCWIFCSCDANLLYNATMHTMYTQPRGQFSKERIRLLSGDETIARTSLTVKSLSLSLFVKTMHTRIEYKRRGETELKEVKNAILQNNATK